MGEIWMSLKVKPLKMKFGGQVVLWSLYTLILVSQNHKITNLTT
jgi:hypothetical protein